MPGPGYSRARSILEIVYSRCRARNVPGVGIFRARFSSATDRIFEG